MKLLIILIAAVWSIDSSEHGVDPAEDLPLKETSQLFEVRMVPAANETQFFVAGVRTKFKKFEKLELKGSYEDQGLEKPFTLFRRQDHFYTKEPLKGRDVKLEIKDTNSGVIERLKIPSKN